LNSRYTINSDLSPFKSRAHIDLLPLARRLWRDRLPSCRLIDIEQGILEFQRTHEDVPGWLVPSLYFDYIRTGDARPLTSVFYHNAMDIVSMAALLNHMSILLMDPLNNPGRNGIDLVSLGRIFQDLGEYDTAADLYSNALENKLPKDILRKLLFNWSYMEKRRENLVAAVKLWKNAAVHDEIFAHIELAKYYEHREKDFYRAIIWTETALDLVKSERFSRIERYQLQPQIEHRLARLNRKNSQADSSDSTKSNDSKPE
jgi:tetratricopeptide (TPR) repeat protein